MKARIHAHVHKRAIADAVGDDADAPICDSSDLRLLLFLAVWIDHPRLQVAWCHRSCSHATYSILPWEDGNYRPSRFASGLCVCSPLACAICDHGLQRLAEKIHPQLKGERAAGVKMINWAGRSSIHRWHCDWIDARMSHDHGHGGCGDGADEHELPGGVLGYRDNLYNQIDRGHVVAFNADGQGQTVIKPWSERNDETSVRVSLITRQVCIPC